MAITIISSPLQGFTDFRFRNAQEKYFGGVDLFYAPYIRLKGKQEIKASYHRDLDPKNNTVSNLVPQVMCNTADDFLFVAIYVQDLGYKELNWNLGCPYPMVTNRGLGSGLIHKTALVDEILKQVSNESDIDISIKMRLGNESSEEIFDLLPVLEKHPLKNIAVHPRIGKQLYKGGVDLGAFQKVVDSTSHTLHYNGNITSVNDFIRLKERFPSIDHWLLGRGIIANPYLAQMMKNGTDEYPENRIEVFQKFHDEIFNAYREALSGDKHLVLKMLSFWEYFITEFKNSPKGLKKIKKAKKIQDYTRTVNEILGSE